ncbi:hypothetical protein GQ53DRAFT_755796 [Thozetella sp. PMI_491]|nr:hypothetical protein GQ53DRAFT_755796 [Thozetella sp. PMI_491]
MPRAILPLTTARERRRFLGFVAPKRVRCWRQWPQRPQHDSQLDFGYRSSWIKPVNFACKLGEMPAKLVFWWPGEPVGPWIHDAHNLGASPGQSAKSRSSSGEARGNRGHATLGLEPARTCSRARLSDPNRLGDSRSRAPMSGGGTDTQAT